MTRFSFAHLTDPHLPLFLSDMRGRTMLSVKRLSGALSWWRKRRHIHQPSVLERTMLDIRESGIRHLVVTGDLVNVSAPAEYVRARAWLESLGSPETVTVVPGNHDLYASGPGPALDLWQPWMRGDADRGDAGFPFVRIRDGVALIGLTTACVTPVFRATGRLGPAQIEALGSILARLGREGLARVVLLHHPPGRAGERRRKGLTDHAELRRILAREGAELVLHGHTHLPVLDTLNGPAGRSVPVIAPSSASAGDPRPALARWHAVHVTRNGGAAPAGWDITVAPRLYRPRTGDFVSGGTFRYTPHTLSTGQISSVG